MDKVIKRAQERKRKRMAARELNEQKQKLAKQIIDLASVENMQSILRKLQSHENHNSYQ